MLIGEVFCYSFNSYIDNFMCLAGFLAVYLNLILSFRFRQIWHQLERIECYCVRASFTFEYNADRENGFSST